MSFVFRKQKDKTLIINLSVNLAQLELIPLNSCLPLVPQVALSQVGRVAFLVVNSFSRTALQLLQIHCQAQQRHLVPNQHLWALSISNSLVKLTCQMLCFGNLVK
jgi:hypothetical protein